MLYWPSGGKSLPKNIGEWRNIKSIHRTSLFLYSNSKSNFLFIITPFSYNLFITLVLCMRYLNCILLKGFHLTIKLAIWSSGAGPTMVSRFGFKNFKNNLSKEIFLIETSTRVLLDTLIGNFPSSLVQVSSSYYW